MITSLTRPLTQAESAELSRILQATERSTRAQELTAILIPVIIILILGVSIALGSVVDIIKWYWIYKTGTGIIDKAADALGNKSGKTETEDVIKSVCSCAKKQRQRSRSKRKRGRL